MQISRASLLRSGTFCRNKCVLRGSFTERANLTDMAEDQIHIFSRSLSANISFTHPPTVFLGFPVIRLRKCVSKTVLTIRERILSI